MNAHRDLGPDFRTWLNDVPPMPADLPRRTLDRSRHTRQRRRWLWFLPGPMPTAGVDDRAGRDRLSPPTTTTRLGGTSTMFSPAKLVTVAAVAALSGALLLAGPFATQVDDPASPAALTDLPTVALVSGQAMATPDDWSMGTVESHDWGFSVTDILMAMTFEMDDERLSGPARFRFNANRGLESINFGPISMSVYLENDVGSWVGTGKGFQAPAATGGAPAAGHHFGLTLKGQDGYAGLTAIVTMDQVDEYSPFEISGAIMPLALAPTPGAAPTDIE